MRPHAMDVGSDGTLPGSRTIPTRSRCNVAEGTEGGPDAPGVVGVRGEGSRISHSIAMPTGSSVGSG